MKDGQGNIAIYTNYTNSVYYAWGTFTDNFDGTIRFDGVTGTFGGNTYTAQTLYFAKCSYGQSWNSSTNNCQGTGNSGNNYGAATVQYCNANDSSCDNGSILNGSGTSGAFTACNSLSLAGKIWRVPTRNELKTLIHCTDLNMPLNGFDCGGGNYTSPSVSNLFPDTPASFYWSSSAWPDVRYALYILFDNGLNALTDKSFPRYVRCVSP